MKYVLLVIILSFSIWLSAEACVPSQTQGQESDNNPPACNATITKSVPYTVLFPREDVPITVTGTGFCKLKTQCGDALPNQGRHECWPQFYTPIRTYGNWSQTVHNQTTALLGYFSCTGGQPLSQAENYACVDSGSPVTFSVSHDCQSCQDNYCRYLQPGSVDPDYCVYLTGCDEDNRYFVGDDGCCFYVPPASPMLIDVDGTGFELSSAEQGVLFDFYGSGRPVKVAWTLAGTTNGWLVLDRNGNGRIDNATEMFGNLSLQPASHDPNGFLALAEFDKISNGGNEDGIIDGHDDIYDSLRLWIDKNHDAVSQPGELTSLSSAGIQSVSLDYQLSKFVDMYGNQYRYRGKVKVIGTGSHWAYDVILQVKSAELVPSNFSFDRVEKTLFQRTVK